MDSGAPSSASAEQPRQVARAACLNCRAAKRKCDGVQPVCGSCMTRQVSTPCQFVASKRGGPRYKGKKVVQNDSGDEKATAASTTSSVKRKRPPANASQSTSSAKKRASVTSQSQSGAGPFPQTQQYPPVAASQYVAASRVPPETAGHHSRRDSVGGSFGGSDRSGTSSGASHSAVTPAMASPLMPVSVMTPILPTMSQGHDPRMDWSKNMSAPPYINSHSFAQSHQRGMGPASSQASNASPRDTLDGSPLNDPNNWQHHTSVSQHHHQQQQHQHQPSVLSYSHSQQQHQQGNSQSMPVYHWPEHGQPPAIGAALPVRYAPAPQRPEDGIQLSSTNLEIFHRMQPQLAHPHPQMASAVAGAMTLGGRPDSSAQFQQQQPIEDLPPMLVDFFSRIETLPKAGPGGDASRIEEPMSFDLETQDYLTDLLGTSIFDKTGGADAISDSTGASTKLNKPGAAVDSESQARLVLSAYYKHVYPACPILLPSSNLTALSTYFSDKEGPCALFAAISACVSLHLSSADAWMTLRGGSRLHRAAKGAAANGQSDADACEPEGDEEMNKAEVTQHDIANHHARTSQWLLQRFAEQQAAAKGLRYASISDSERIVAQMPPVPHNTCGLKKDGSSLGVGPITNSPPPLHSNLSVPRDPLGTSAISASHTSGSPSLEAKTTASSSENLPPRPFCSVTPDMDLLNMEATAARVLLAHFHYGKDDPTEHIHAHRIAVGALEGCDVLKLHEDQHVAASEQQHAEVKKDTVFSPALRTEWARRLLWCSYSAATVITATGGFAPLPRTITRDSIEDLDLRPSKSSPDNAWIVLIRGSQHVSRVYRILYELEVLRQNARKIKRKDTEQASTSSPKPGDTGASTTPNGNASLARYSAANGSASTNSSSPQAATTSPEPLQLIRQYTAQRDRLYDDATRVDHDIVMYTRYDLSWREQPSNSAFQIEGGHRSEVMSPTNMAVNEAQSELDLARSLRVAGKCMTTGSTIILHRARAYADARILMQPHCGMPGIQLEEPEWNDAEGQAGSESQQQNGDAAAAGKEALPSVDELMTDLKGASTADERSSLVRTPSGSGSALPPPSTLVLPDSDSLSASFGPFAPSYSFNRCRDAADSMYRALVPILRSDDGLSAPSLPPYSACSCLLAAYVLLMQTLAVQVGSYSVATTGNQGGNGVEAKLSNPSTALTPNGANGTPSTNDANGEVNPYALVDHFRQSVRHLESVLDRFARVWAKARSYKDEVSVLLAANESLAI